MTDKVKNVAFDLSSRMIQVEGPPHQRGITHGEICRTIIHEGIRKWKDYLGEAAGIHPDRYITDFFAETDYLTAIKAWSPDLLEEVSGISEGSGIDYNTVLAYQLFDEELYYRRWKHQKKNNHVGTGCSAIGVIASETNPTLLAQNMDLVGYMDGGQVLLHVQQDGMPEAYVLTLAGMIGLCGMNNLAIGICCNQLAQIESAPAGLPVSFLIRKVLEQSDFHSAERVLTQIPHASGQNYLIGGPNDLADYECSAKKTVQYRPTENSAYICHTNHPLTSIEAPSVDDLRSESSVSDHAEINRETINRLIFLHKELDDPGNVTGVETIKTILSSQETPVCKNIDPNKAGHSNEVFTFGSLVMTLSAQPSFAVSFGPPCQRQYFQLECMIS